MCDTRLPLTECTPAAHHGRRFDIGASLPDLSPGPHLVPPFRVPSVPSYTPLPTLLPAYGPHCTLTRTSTTRVTTNRRDIHQEEDASRWRGPWRCRGPCAANRPTSPSSSSWWSSTPYLPLCYLFLLSLSLARSYLTSLTPIDAFILRPSLPQPAKCHFSRHRLNEAL